MHAARVIVVRSVCLLVCYCFNSLFDGLFLTQAILPTQQVMRINLIEQFSLKMLCCRDLSANSIHTVGHFTIMIMAYLNQIQPVSSTVHGSSRSNTKGEYVVLVCYLWMYM